MNYEMDLFTYLDVCMFDILHIITYNTFNHDILII